MNIFETLKNLYWNNTFMSNESKEKVFYSIKGLVRGKSKGGVGNDADAEYVKQILDGQKLNNSFSLNHPTKLLIELQANDPKILAYYLPQFYPDPHNDEWWGKGSTEWTNTTKAAPQYIGQYQPRLPGELGFYDLRIQDNIRRQVELAKYYGVYGFCFYYYWFNGTRLLDVPFENFVNDASIDFPFCICWVNESWTKQWNGASNEVLVEVRKTVEVYKNFIHNVTRLFNKSNYICIDDKALLVVYRPFEVPNPKEVLEHWREVVRKECGKELYILAAINGPKVINEKLHIDGFDAISEFAPGPQMEFMNDIKNTKKFVCDEFFGKVYDYKEFVESKKYFKIQNPKLYRAVSPMWDNTARKMNKGLILDGATPELYKQWLKDIIVETKNNKNLDDQLIFINAWNEWAEGTYLEPDLKWQYQYLEATKDAILEAREIKEL